LDGHTNAVTSICFSPDSTILASGSADKSICLWDVKTGQKKKQLDGHTDAVTSICFSPDSTILASGSED
jgi:WD40 repeat protein